MKFDNNQLYHIYGYLTGSDQEFVKEIAKTAIESATELQRDMTADIPDSPMFDNNDIRTRALQFTKDQVQEFLEMLLEEIKQVKFDAHIRVERKITTDLKFPD